MDVRNRNLSEAASTDYSSMFSTHSAICTIHTRLKYKNFPRKRSQSLSREDALRLFSIGTTVAKKSGSKTLSGQVYDYRVPHWRVQDENNDWEELSRQEMHLDGPEDAPTIPMGIPPNRSTSVASMVC